MFVQSYSAQEELLIPMSRLPDEKLINSEVMRLRALVYLVPHFNLFGDDNQERIKVAIDVLTNNWSHDDIYNLEDEIKVFEGLEAKRWLETGGTCPSSEWDALAQVQRVPIQNAETFLGPAEAWIPNSHHIAAMLVEKHCPLFKGAKICYGYWQGELAATCKIKACPLVRHGWAMSTAQPSHIIDPCRWIFEDSIPYIYIGPNDHYAKKTHRNRFT